MPITLSFIAEKVGGQLIGSGDTLISGTAPISHVASGQMTFAMDATHWQRCVNSPATAAVVSGFVPDDGSLPIVVVPNAEEAFAIITEIFRPAVKRVGVGISPLAHVSPLAQIGQNVSIYPGAFVGAQVVIGDNTIIMSNAVILENCRIGSDVKIFPNVTMYENTVIGDRCLIHAGVVLGAYGFGYRTQNGSHRLTAQLGSVEIGNDVDIGANTTIDRGTFDATVVGDGTKIDDQVMIGHNCRIGRHNLLCSQVGIAGSCTTGDYVVMAGQVGVGDHINIGDQVILGAKAGVMNSIPSKQHYLGIPATPIREQMQIMAATQKLPELRKQIVKLNKQVEGLVPVNETLPLDLEQRSENKAA